MKSAELLRKLKKIAKQRGLDLKTEAGKGSHQKVWLGGHRTIIPVHGTELKPGTLSGILKDLGIEKEDL